MNGQLVSTESDEDREFSQFRVDGRTSRSLVYDEALKDIENGEEFLLYYARHGEASIVKRLLNSKKLGQIELNIDCKGKKKSNHGWTPLHLSVYFGHYNVVKSLLEYGANINVVNDTGDTPLHKAAYIGRLDIVLLLLTHDANVFCKNGEGKTARDLCQNQEIHNALTCAEESDMRKKEDKFLRASRDGDLDLIKELLNDINPVNINCKDTSGNTALHWAAYRNHKEIVVYLLQNGIDSNIENNQGQTPATMAASIQAKQLIHQIQSLSLNLSIYSSNSNNIYRFEGPLIRKSKHSHRKCIWAVLERGVLFLFSNRADALSGAKHRDYKSLERAMVEPSSKDQASFNVYFHDNTKISLAVLPDNPNSALSDRQKWVKFFNDHISYANKFFYLPVKTCLREDVTLTNVLSSSDGGDTSDSNTDDIYDELDEHRGSLFNHPSNIQRPESWKTLVAMAYFFLVTWITAFVMVIVHDRVPDMATYPPLPDIFLDNVPLIPWAFKMCEVCGVALFLIWCTILVLHKHRFILLRRMFSLFGSVFLLRCFTMLITSLSVPGRHLNCKARVGIIWLPYGNWTERLNEAYVIWAGGGMSIKGVRTCGDYMFSGHTVTLTLLNFFITEYTPPKMYYIHTLSWVLNLFGVFFILAAHEHYSIDVFIAFYISTRLFLYYHTLANNRALYQKDRKRTRIWFPLFSFFESGVNGIVPNQFEQPFKAEFAKKWLDKLVKKKSE